MLQVRVPCARGELASRMELCWSAGVGGECCGELAALSVAAPPPTDTERALDVGTEPEAEKAEAEAEAETMGEPTTWLPARERDARDELKAELPESAAPAPVDVPVAPPPAACDLEPELAALLRVPNVPEPMNRSIWLPSCRKKCSNSSRCLRRGEERRGVESEWRIPIR